MFRRNSKARIFRLDVVLFSNSWPKARACTRAGLRMVEYPGVPFGTPDHLAGTPAVARPAAFVYAGSVGHGFDAAESWQINQASVRAGSRAFGWPFAGFGAEPPFVMP